MDFRNFKEKLTSIKEYKKNYLVTIVAFVVPGSFIFLPAYYFCVKPLYNRYKKRNVVKCK